MSLEKFCHDRLVVLRSDASAYEAARAMTNNHVGAVLVTDHGRLTGIVTDRDLALRAGRTVPMGRISVKAVMTPNPATIEIDDTLAHAAALMHSRHVRRLVVLNRRRPAGLVTLDDLVLSRATLPRQLRKIVYAQLTDEAPAKPRGATRPSHGGAGTALSAHRRLVRSRSHRAQTMRAFTQRLTDLTGIEPESAAVTAFEIVASNIARRLLPTEAKDFAAQLPAALREKVRGRPLGADRLITRSSIERMMSRRLRVAPKQAAELVSRVGKAMGGFVSAGELADISAQLPPDLRPLFQGDLTVFTNGRRGRR